MIEVSPEEGFFCPERNFMNQNKTKIIILIGIMGAISLVLQLLEFPHIGFLLEFSDLPSAVIAASFGPVPGVATELVKKFIEGFNYKNRICRRAC